MDISVIVPVYNVEKYLPKCIDSILAQTFTNFELLLINDGSKDSSRTICDEYAAKDSRIRVFHKENGGVSSARNLGLDNAKGEWIAFVDSDDWVDDDYLLSVINIAKRFYSDIVTYGEKCHKLDKLINNKLKDIEYIDLNSRECINNLHHHVWGYVIRKEIITSNRIIFDTSLKYAEDVLFLFMCVGNSKKISSISKTPYNYNTTNNSAVSNISHENNLDHLRVAEILINNQKIDLFSSTWVLLLLIRYITCVAIFLQGKTYINKIINIYNSIQNVREFVTINNFYDKYSAYISVVDRLKIKFSFCYFCYLYLLIRIKR